MIIYMYVYCLFIQGEWEALEVVVHTDHLHRIEDDLIHRQTLTLPHTNPKRKKAL